MKKLLLFLITFLIPFGVYAEETTDVTLKELVLKKTEGYIEVLSDAEIVDNKIVLNLKMYEVGDSAEYQFVVENKSSQDFLADTKNLVSDNPTITYELVGENKSNLVEKNSSKKFTLTVTYQNEVERTAFRGGKYDVSSNKLIALRDPSLINPVTGSIFFSILLTILVLTIGMFVLKNIKVKYFLFLLLFIPFYTFAYYEYDILLESNIIIGYVTPNPCTYDGELVDDVEYVNGQYIYTYAEDSEGWAVLLTDKDSTDPVTTTLCTSINGKPIVSMSGMFVSSKTTSIDTSSFDTSHVVNFSGMFYDCDNLISIDVSNFDLSHSTYGFSGTFGDCYNLESINLSNIDFTNAGFSMQALTSGNSSPKLKSINLSNAIFPADCGYAFGGLSNLKTIILDNVDTSNVTNMVTMFYNCSSLIELDLSSFDTSNVTAMHQMFYMCSSLTDLDVSSFDTSNIISMLQMFYKCSSLTDLDLSNFDTSNVTNMQEMFYMCSSLSSLNVSTFDTSNVVTMLYMMAECPELKTIDVTNWNTSNVEQFRGLFFNSGFETLDLSNWDFRKGQYVAFARNIIVPNGLKELILENTKFSSMSDTFASMYNVEYIDLKNADTSEVAIMHQTFAYSSKINNIDLTNIDTSNVTDMGWMFYGLQELEELDLSSFDFSNVSQYNSIFGACNSLTNIYVGTQDNVDLLNSLNVKPSGATISVKT